MNEDLIKVIVSKIKEEGFDFDNDSVLDETDRNRENDEFVDDSILHVIRHGVRFSVFEDQSKSEKFLGHRLNKLVKVIDNTITKSL